MGHLLCAWCCFCRWRHKEEKIGKVSPWHHAHRALFPFMDIATQPICLASPAGGYHLATVTSASMNIPVQRVLNFKFFKNIFSWEFFFSVLFGTYLGVELLTCVVIHITHIGESLDRPSLKAIPLKNDSACVKRPAGRVIVPEGRWHGRNERECGFL